MNRRSFCQVFFLGIAGALVFEEGLFRGLAGSFMPLRGWPEEDVDKGLEEAGYSVPDISEEYKQIIDNKEFSIRIFGEAGDREKIKGALEYLKKASDIDKEVFTNLDKIKTFYRKDNQKVTRMGSANTSDPSFRPRIVYCNRSFLGADAKSVASLIYHETTHISGHNDELVPYLNELKFLLTVY
jgi:hypothetical protein